MESERNPRAGVCELGGLGQAENLIKARVLSVRWEEKHSYTGLYLEGVNESMSGKQST